MADGINVKAIAHVKLVKLDNNGNIVDVTERDIELTDKEVQDIWRLR